MPSPLYLIGPGDLTEVDSAVSNGSHEHTDMCPLLGKSAPGKSEQCRLICKQAHKLIKPSRGVIKRNQTKGSVWELESKFEARLASRQSS